MQKKRVLLGISGGIAAYKIAFLIRLLKKEGAEVKCIMTPASCDFISPLVVATLSENPVGIEFWNKQDGTWNNHVEYGLWADVFVVAPATANTIAKMASGACDNLVLATYLSMKGKSMVAPAMDLDMYNHPATKRNLEQLTNDGVVIIPAESGELASGLVGEGRLAEPENILRAIKRLLLQRNDLAGKKILVTAGPTYEALDPVRFIGNHSSGKMGFAIAEELLMAGAEVVLVSGPTQLTLSHPNLHFHSVNSADEMFIQVEKVWKNMDGGIFSAAVADYKPAVKAEQKIKKSEDTLELSLVKNIDILAWAGQHKQNHQTLVGFALETSNLESNGRLKLQKKNLDFIVLNTLEDKGAGFGGTTNKISILDIHNNLRSFELKSKMEVAADIVDYFINFKK